MKENFDENQMKLFEGMVIRKNKPIQISCGSAQQTVGKCINRLRSCFIKVAKDDPLLKASNIYFRENESNRTK